MDSITDATTPPINHQFSSCNGATSVAQSKGRCISWKLDGQSYTAQLQDHPVTRGRMAIKHDRRKQGSVILMAISIQIHACNSSAGQCIAEHGHSAQAAADTPSCCACRHPASTNASTACCTISWLATAPTADVCPSDDSRIHRSAAIEKSARPCAAPSRSRTHANFSTAAYVATSGAIVATWNLRERLLLSAGTTYTWVRSEAAPPFPLASLVPFAADPTEEPWRLPAGAVEEKDWPTSTSRPARDVRSDARGDPPCSSGDSRSGEDIGVVDVWQRTSPTCTSRASSDWTCRGTS